jgi:hypothetical protein
VSTGIVTRPDISDEIIKSDYLNFLREQIRLEPRGPEWNTILQNRLNALESFAGKKVIVANFRQRPESASLYIDTETGNFFILKFIKCGNSGVAELAFNLNCAK